MNWKIYYADETTFDDTQGSPEDAPSLDIQVIVMSDPDNGRKIIQKGGRQGL